MKVLVIGNGGREHAIIDKLSESKHVDQIYAAPGNTGYQNCTLVNIKVTDVEALVDFALKNNIDMTVVGPEASLACGIVDLFKEKGLKIFGPTKAASQVETSKDFAKQIMAKYNIPTAEFKTFTNYEEAYQYVVKKGAPIVIKYDGLAQGKGVVVAKTLDEAVDALKDMLINDIYGNAKVVVEECLGGPEFSFMCLVDGTNVYPLDIAQDHKRAYDNDLGPNTGGMGAYSSVDLISDSDKEYALEHIMKPMAEALVKENASFSGILYGGLMKTQNGIKVIEFNARFGDPETEVVLPRLKSDLYEAFDNIINHKSVVLEWKDEYALGIVLASKGYPLNYTKGSLIENLENVDAKVYFMGVDKKESLYYTNGGRVLIVVGFGKTIKDARDKALCEVKKIKCDNLFYRSDIGHLSIKE